MIIIGSRYLGGKTMSKDKDSESMLISDEGVKILHTNPIDFLPFS